MRKILSKIKNNKPSKYICYLYFFVPIFVSAISKMDKENDIWFLLNYGKYILKNGFPTIEPFTMHSNFSFVMQQWLSAVIFYIAHSILGQYGILIVTLLINILILYFLYKLCMILSEDKFRLSIIISCITDVLLLIFMVPRPWLFTMLNLIIILYIMELYYKKNNKKALYFLPLISILQINFQSSMWFMLYLFMLPYIVCLIFDRNNKQDNKIYRLLTIIICMLLVGLINPYGINNILYVFNSYGNSYIDNVVIEMLPVSLSSGNGSSIIYSLLFYIIFLIEIIIYMYAKRGKFELRHLFLFLGVTILGLKNIRNIWLFMIGTIPFLASYMKEYFSKLNNEEKKERLSQKEKNNYVVILIFLSIYTIIFAYNSNELFTNEIKPGIDKILSTSDADSVTLYTNYDNGSYAEYRGLKPYIDTRAEIFIKNINKKEDILEEYYLLCNGYIKYQDFVDKYNFTHMIINKNERIYIDACNDKNYRVIYEGKDYKVFEKMDK